MRNMTLKFLASWLIFPIAMITSAQTPTERAELPIRDPIFKGKTGKTFEDSTPDFPQGVKAPDGAPNVVVILLDDVGFGQPDSFLGN